MILECHRHGKHLLCLRNWLRIALFMMRTLLLSQSLPRDVHRCRKLPLIQSQNQIRGRRARKATTFACLRVDLSGLTLSQAIPLSPKPNVLLLNKEAKMGNPFRRVWRKMSLMEGRDARAEGPA